MSKILHQFVTGATAGDAITQHALLLRRWLREMGLKSTIYAQHIDNSMRGEIDPLAAYHRQRDERHLIYHHSIGSDVAPFLIKQNIPLIQIYHNITPAHFFQHIDPMWVHLSTWGYEQLALLQPLTVLGLAVSAYNEQHLRRFGYERTGVFPIPLPRGSFDLPLDPVWQAHIEAHRPNILFVGRFAPNKRQDQLVQLLYHLKKIRPTAHLYLVGQRWTVGYDRWVEMIAQRYGLSDNVTITGGVSQAVLGTFYRSADLYLSLSDHEGFGQPLLESMACDLPIIAYASSGIAETLGGASILVRQKGEWGRLAELVDIVWQDRLLRQQLIAQQRHRLESFAEQRIYQQWVDYLAPFGYGKGL